MSGLPLNRRTMLATATRTASVLIGWLSLSGCITPPTGPLQVWVVSGARGLGAQDRPLPENEVYSASRGGVRVAAAINDTVSLQIGLRTTAPPAGPLDVRLTRLTGPAGSLPESAAQLYRVHATRIERFASWYPAHTNRPATPGSLPDVLVPWGAARGGGPLRLEDGGTQAIWLDVQVPPTTAPGAYAGRVEVVDMAASWAVGPPAGSSSPVVFSCGLELTVLPVAIPGPPSLPVVCRVDPRELLAAHLSWPRVEAEETRILPDDPSHQSARRLVDAAMRLLHEHRTTPVLWASFPKYRATGPRTTEIDWPPYDQLVAGWLNGDAFDDRVAAACWPVPASLTYPDAERNGGFDSARYARLLAAYLAECQRHFTERGWLDRAVLRLLPPGGLDEQAVARVTRLASVVRQSEARLPIVAHLPPRTLRTLGWHGAPLAELPQVDVWSPPAAWFEPEALQRERGLGKRAWFVPGAPPYCPALAVEAPPTDARALAWQAFAYRTDGVWIEHAADAGGSPRVDATAPLVYPGTPYGLNDRPVPSIRLKRLRDGLLDYELLRLLERNGRPLLADQAARRLIRRGFTDACDENLLSWLSEGWSDDPAAYLLARRVILTELANAFAPSPASEQEQQQNLVEWERTLSLTARLTADVRGVRLTTVGSAMHVHAMGQLVNDADRPVEGRWSLPKSPVGWKPLGQAAARVAARGRARTAIQFEADSLAYDASGVLALPLAFDSPTAGAFATEARVAVTSCPFVERPPTIDGDLSDWPIGSNNVAGDFRLVRGSRADSNGRLTLAPTLPTRAAFCRDRERLYVGVYCGLPDEEQPLWRADNQIPIDGAIPWGQDVVEILLDPSNALEGDGGGLYALQVKPSGLLVARHGALTDPPMNDSRPWTSGAAAAARTERGGWSVELAVPFAAFAGAGYQTGVWGCNVTRLDARRGEYSSWSGARGHCYAPHRLGNLLFVE